MSSKNACGRVSYWFCQLRLANIVNKNKIDDIIEITDEK